MDRMRVLTGMRPTGRLHLGHYCGALSIWLDYVRKPEVECQFLIADYQALGDNSSNVEKIRDSVIQVAIDWLAVGLDPEVSPFVVQSYVPQHAELTMLLSTITPNSWLLHNPTLKIESDQLTDMQRTVGFMTYPMSQVADILLPRAHVVPAGEDQTTHVEFTRRVAKRFNKIYGTNLFPLPSIALSQTPRLVGTDGNAKMGKSTNNAIFLSDSADEVGQKVRRMKTDPNRIHADTPGTIEDNVPFMYLDVFDPDKDGLTELKAAYERGAVRDVDVKDRLTRVLNTFLDPIRERRAEIEKDRDYVKDVLLTGSATARAIAEDTMLAVRTAMKIEDYA